MMDKVAVIDHVLFFCTRSLHSQISLLVLPLFAPFPLPYHHLYYYYHLHLLLLILLRPTKDTLPS